MNPRVLAQNYFRRVHKALDSSKTLALVRFDGLAILRPTQLTDLGFLPFAAATTAKYFKPAPMDIFFLNDPYSGGSSLSQLTFLGCIAPGWIVVDRSPFLPVYRSGTTIDQEGLRIPPTPLVMNHTVNKEVLASIASHPFCGHNFEATTLKFVEDFQARMRALSTNEILLREIADEDHVKSCLDYSTEMWRERLRELAIGEATEEVLLDDDSRVRLKISIRNGLAHFDFNGTSAAKGFALPARASASICASTLLQMSHWTGPVHTGLMDCIQMQTPTDTLIDAKFPAATQAGLTDGATLLATLVARTLHRVDALLPATEIYPNSCSYHLVFEDSLVFTDTTMPGAPATSTGPGFTGFGSWNIKTVPPAIEAQESQFPVLFRFVGARQHSAGKGLYEGGSGATKIVEVLKPAKLVWNWLPYSAKAEGAEGGKMGLHPEIAVQRKNEKKPTLLPHHGEMALQVGDEVVVSSAGGGGYGTVPEATPADETV